MKRCLWLFAFVLALPAFSDKTSPKNEKNDSQPIAKMEQGLEGITDALSEISDKVKIDGFLAADFSKSDAAFVPSTTSPGSILTPTYHGISQEYSFLPGSLVGLQFSANLSDKTDVIVQIVGKGYSDYPDVDSYELNTSWAFLRYQHNEHLTAKVGRVIIPTYLLSQYTNIAYAYPWIEPPQEIYGIFEIPSANGAILTLSQELANDWLLEVEPFIATTTYQREIASLGVRTDLNNVLGTGVSLSNDVFKAVAMYANGEVEINNGLPVSIATGVTLPAYRSSGYFYSFGTQFDNTKLLIMAEYSHAVRDSGYIPNQEAWYVLGGLHIGKLMPFMTYAELRQSNKNSINQLTGAARAIIGPNLLQEQKSINAGLRYDVSSKVALKATVTQVSPQNGTRGLFSVTPNQKHVMIYRLGLNCVF